MRSRLGQTLLILAMALVGPACRSGREGEAPPVKTVATLDDQIRELSTALGRDSSDADIAFRLGRAYLTRAHRGLYRSRTYLIITSHGYALRLSERDARQADASAARKYLLTALAGDSLRADTYRELGYYHIAEWFLTGGRLAPDPHLKKAAEYFSTSLKCDSSSAATYRGLGFTSDLASEHEAAIAYLRKAVAIDPADAESWVLLGDVCLGRRDHEEAWDAYRRAMDCGFETPENYLHMAVVYATDDMMVTFHKAIQGIPPAIKAYFNLGVQWFRKSPDRQSIELCNRALAMDSAFQAVYPVLALEYFAVGDTQNALRAARSAFTVPVREAMQGGFLETIPPDIFSMFGMGQSLVERIMRDEPDNPFFWYALGEREMVFEPWLAVGSFKRVTALDPGYPGIHAALGTAYVRQKDTTNAAVQFEQAFRIGEDVRGSRITLGRILQFLLDRDDRAGILELLRRNIDRGTDVFGAPFASDSAMVQWRVNGKTNNAIYVAWAHCILGAELIGRADLETPRQSAYVADAMQTFMRAARLAPEFAPAHFGLGLLCARKGDFPSAVRYFEKGLAYDAGNAAAEAQLGIYLERSGQTDRALAEFRKSLASDPKPNYWTTETYSSYGRASAADGRLDEAIGAFTRSLQLWPMDATTLYDLAMVYDRKGNRDQKAACLEQSARLGNEKAKAIVNVR